MFWYPTVVSTAWGSTFFKKWQFCVFLDFLHLRASYAIPRRSFVYKNMVKCFSDKKNVFYNFFFSIFDKKSTFLAQNELKNALLGVPPKIAIFSHFCWFIATHQTIHHTMWYFTIWKACQKVAHALYFVPIYKFIGLQWTWKAVSPLKEAQYQQNWAKMPLQPFS